MENNEEKAPLVRIGVDMDEKLYIEFKKKTTEERKTMTNKLREMIENYLNS